MLRYFTKIYKKLRKNDKNDVFLCFIVFLLDFKKDLKMRKSSQRLLMTKPQRMQKCLVYHAIF